MSVRQHAVRKDPKTLPSRKNTLIVEQEPSANRFAIDELS